MCEKKSIYELMNDMESLKESIVDRKFYIQKEINELDIQIEAIEKEMELAKESNLGVIVLSEMWDKREELYNKRKPLLLERKIIRGLDYNNELTYNMLGYKIKGYYNLLGIFNLNKDGSDIDVVVKDMNIAN